MSTTAQTKVETRTLPAVRRRACAALVALAGLVPLASQAQGYPDRPINLIVPFPAGGGIDVPGRVIAEYVGRKWKVPVNVINKPGASGATGTLEALTAKPDGYTLLIDSGASSSIQSEFVKNLPYTLENRSWVGRSLALPMAYIVKADSPYRTLKDVEAAVKREPTKFVWATAAPSTVLNLSLSQFFRQVGVPVTTTRRVVTSGCPAVAQALAGGHVEFGACAINAALPLIESGKLRAIGVLMPARVPQLADVATTTEQGYPQLNATAWVGVSGPPGLPADVIAAWGKVLAEAATDPAFREAAAKVGTVPFHAPSDAYRAFVLEETEAAKQALE
jgi:tripartite-type tricarboxylate transporter receptor subunit TctC